MQGNGKSAGTRPDRGLARTGLEVAIYCSFLATMIFVPSVAQAQTATERAALVALYDATDGDNWTDNTNWKTQEPVGDWYGVTVENGVVTKLDIYRNNLTGTLPSEIEDLTNLEWLGLQNNNLRGEIPAEIGNLTSLVFLDLADNFLNGEVPAETGNLTSVEILHFHNNQLSGAIPAEIGDLTSLEVLGLHGNSLSGAIPAEIGDLTGLEVLWLHNNSLTGAIPSEIGDLTSLWLLILSSNQLSGTIPTEIGNLTSLERLSLGHNQLTGAIPAEIGNLTSLEELWLEDNSLTGSIPAEIGNLISLTNLQLHSNSLTGAIPAEIGKLTSLEGLDLGHNTELTGELPAGLRLLPINYLDIRETCITTPADSDFQAWLAGITFRDTDRVCAVGVTVMPTALSVPEGSNAKYTVVLDAQPSANVTISLSLASGADEDITTDKTSLTFTTDNWDAAQEITVLAEEDDDALNGVATIEHSASGGGYGGVTVPSVTATEADNDNNVDAERAALVAIYDATDGDNWTENMNWKSQEPVGEWYGVTVDNGVVTELELPDNNLTGEIPAEIGNLTSLWLLILSSNQLSGTIPTEIGNLTNLHHLHLDDNSLSGAIPTEIENLTRLDQLGLGSNLLSGSIPSEIGNLTNLRFLNLRSNSLSGEIPSEIGNLTRFEQLYLSGNSLSGEIPSEIGNLTRLEILQLDGNSLSGEIPTEIGNLTSLTWLSLERNNLTGAIPAEIGNLTRLEVLRGDRNQLSGSIPAEIGNLTSLQNLSLEHNNLTGAIPAKIGNLTSLGRLDLWQNSLSGEIPSEIGNLTSLGFLDLRMNSLSGEIPSEIGKLTNLEVLWLHDNQLSGAIPSEIGNLTSLAWLDLRMNSLSGPMPAEIGNLTSLERLRLDDNQLSGAIPSEIGNLTSLQDLSLDHNNLTGAIPAEIANLTSLEWLDLSYNTELTGELPAGLRLLPVTTLDIQNTCITTPADSDFQAWLAGITFYDTDRVCAAGVTVTPTALSVPEGSNAKYTVVLDAQPSADVTITLSLASGSDTDITIDKPSLTFTTDNWSTTQEVTVKAAEDDDALNGAATIAHAASGGGYGGVSVPSVTATEEDNDNDADAERAALVALYDATDGDNWTENANWKSQEPVGDWEGVTVENGAVTGLDLDGNNLTGTLPSAMGDLTSLKDLHLWDNSLSGAIPTEIGNLTRLERLRLDRNSLSGAIPTEIGNLTRLERLRLDSNSLSGAIPTEIGDLTSLDGLWLDKNELSGPIPTEIGKLTRLEWLWLDHNNLTGEIPAEIGNLTRLRRLDLTGNAFSGEIPVEIANLTSLTWLSLERNNLTGAIPSAIANLTSLEWLDLSHNTELTGELPAGLRLLPVTVLDIRNTCITTPADSNFQTWLAGIAFFDTDRVCVAGVTVTPTALTVPEGSSAKYTVVLTSQPSADITISLSFASGSDEDITVDKTSLAFTTDNWDTAQTVTVSAAEDTDTANGTATIEHTVSGGGYGGVTVSSVTATEADNDAAGVTVTPTVLTVPEGSNAKYTVVLDTQPSADVTISVSLAAGSDADITVDKTSLTFTTDNWGAAQEITVSAAEDDDATDGTATIEHTASGGGYGGVSVSSITATEADNDAAGVTVTPTALTVAEGSSATYTVVLDTEPSADVTIAVSFAAGSDVDITVDKTSLTFTTDSWSTTQEITVSAEEDDDALNGVATIEHSAAGGGYGGVTVSSVTATELDNDEAGVTVTPTALSVTEGSNAKYTVVLDTQPSGDVTISVSFASGSDEDITVDKTSLTFTPDNWSMAQEVTVTAAVDNDTNDDAAVLNHKASGGDYGEVTIADVVVTVTDVIGGVDVSGWLARYSRVGAGHLLSSLENRMERLDRTSSGAEVSVAGQRIVFGDSPARPGMELSGASAIWSASQSYTTSSLDGRRSVGLMKPFGMSSGLNAAASRYTNMTLRDALSRSAFRYAREMSSGNSFGVWGQGSFSRFSGSESGEEMYGDVMSGTVGVDNSFSGWLHGLAVSRSESEGAYRIAGKDSLSLSASLTGIYPYARYKITDRLRVWGTGGYGRGSLRLQGDSLASSSSDLSMALGSIGVSGDIVSAGSQGFGLSWQTDAMLLRSSLASSRSLSSVEAIVHRLRLSLESSYTLRMGERASLAPKLRLGVRRDGGDAEQGMGLDVAGGLGFVNSAGVCGRRWTCTVCWCMKTAILSSGEYRA